MCLKILTLKKQKNNCQLKSTFKYIMLKLDCRPCGEAKEIAYSFHIAQYFFRLDLKGFYYIMKSKSDVEMQ